MADLINVLCLGRHDELVDFARTILIFVDRLRPCWKFRLVGYYLTIYVRLTLMSDIANLRKML